MGLLNSDSRDIFLDQAKDFILKYKNFEIINVKDKLFLSGTIYLDNENGEIADYYNIKIEYDKSYPKRFPSVYETSNKIPKNIDWHIFEGPDNCCLCSLPEELIYCNEKYDLISFFEDFVIPYFYAQIFRNRNGYFLKERPHGDLGWISFFFEKLKTKNIDIVKKSIYFVLNNIKLERTSKCYCGSNLKFRKCHRDSLLEIRKLNNLQLKNFYDRINSLIN